MNEGVEYPSDDGLNSKPVAKLGLSTKASDGGYTSVDDTDILTKSPDSVTMSPATPYQKTQDLTLEEYKARPSQITDLNKKLLSPKTRSKFVGKVVAIVNLKLLLSTLTLTYICWYPHFFYTLQKTGLLIVASAICLTTFCMLACSKKNSKTVPLNYILVFLFAVSVGMLLGILALGAPPVSLFVMGICIIAPLVGPMLYAFLASGEVTFCPMLLASIGSGMIPMLLIYKQFQDVNMLFVLGVCVLSFGIFIIVDVMMVAEDSSMTVDDYIYGAMFIYIDIIRIILEILIRIAAESK